ncbi:MAG: hypothetical protein NZ602_04520 [Thermoguttaceae bacterium]|nr:hypothetical protein [Thermoguttaceae bacterium]MDW8036612.1 hypothetical protein [Thermoguttaceae bacterium]
MDRCPAARNAFSRRLAFSRNPRKEGEFERGTVEKGPSEKTILQNCGRKIYIRPDQLAKLTRPTVCILDIQHPDRIYEQFRTLAKPIEQCYACPFQRRIAEISDLQTIVVHATEVTGQDLDQTQIKAIQGDFNWWPKQVAATGSQ